MRGDPASCYERWRGDLGSTEALLLVSFQLEQYWLQDGGSLDLTALYCIHGGKLHVAVTDRRLRPSGLPPLQQYREWVEQYGLVDVIDSGPIKLQPLHIAKPWGREVWYSGVEQRGVCDFAGGRGRTPIPWLQAVLPGAVAGKPGEGLLLLKILDPSASPVVGELYFELHEEKREVYVVTHVDLAAWPDGIGYIRIGFDPECLARYESEAHFRQAYLAAVRDYESVRRSLDEGAGELQPVDELLARERELREAMNRFTGLRPLTVADVVEIPPLLPHSLQHGVRAIEFQTPSYERKILSFPQKVLTQDCWDTGEVIDRMHLRLPAPRPFPQLHLEEGILIERIVDFPDFEVRRASLSAGTHWEFEASAGYALVIVVEGALALAGSTYRVEEAALLPRSWRGILAAAEAAQPLVFLLAMPRG